MSERDQAEAAAERIIRLEGLTFALAVSAGRDDDLRTAREMLKAAIVREITAAADRGASPR